MKRFNAQRPTGIHPPESTPIVRIGIVVLVLLAALRPGVEGRQQGTTLSVREFRERLATLVADSGLDRALIGLKIVLLDDTTTVAAVNPQKLLHPASNMKLLTTAAALAVLPAHFTFRTNVTCDAPIEGSELSGNLYVTGGGDALLDTNDVDSIAAIVAASGIRRIEGDLVADLSRFDTLAWGAGWMWDDEPDPDEAFISSLSFNHASVSVIVGPGPAENAPLEWKLIPAMDSLAIDNVALTLAAGAADSVIVTRIRGVNRVTIRGTMSVSSAPETTTISVRWPELHLLQYLRSRLISRGVEVAGALRSGNQAGVIFLGRIERPLGPVLSRVNKISDNLAAECLLKAISIEIAGTPGTASGGLSAVGSYLTSAGVDQERVITADGSGVSFYDAVAPEDIIAVLRDQYSRKATFGEFCRSLPRSGYDGTLSGRMKGPEIAGRIRAKTGSLTGVSTISGYVTTLSNHQIAFSIMVNHYHGKNQRLRAWQDAILNDLVRLDPDRQGESR